MPRLVVLLLCQDLLFCCYGTICDFVVMVSLVVLLLCRDLLFCCYAETCCFVVIPRLCDKTHGPHLSRARNFVVMVRFVVCHYDEICCFVVMVSLVILLLCRDLLFCCYAETCCFFVMIRLCDKTHGRRLRELTLTAPPVPRPQFCCYGETCYFVIMARRVVLSLW
jgi:hypothetical protein